MTKPGPKELRQRALGQSRHSNGRFAGPEGQGASVAQKPALAGLSHLEHGSVTVLASGAEDRILEPQSSSAGFDRKAYQRLYMRLYRARKRAPS